MPQVRKYADPAEKQRAYRARRQAARTEQQQTRPAADVQTMATAAPRLDMLHAPADVQADMQERRALMDAVGL